MKKFLLSISVIVFFISCKEETPVAAIKETSKPSYNHKSAVGESARDILSAEKFNYLQIEIQFITGFAPSQAALNNLRNFLMQRLNKPSGIEFVSNSIDSPNKNSYSINDIDAIEQNFRTVFSRADTLGIYFFFADGGFSEDSDNSKVLGVAYRNTSMALFQKTIQSLSGGINQPERSKLETVVLNHEFCHIMGLVNVGSSIQVHHQDEAHGKHCNNTNCLMHYSVETGNIVVNLLGGSMPQLDANCIEDLRGDGGK